MPNEVTIVVANYFFKTFVCKSCCAHNECSNISFSLWKHPSGL